MPASPSKISKKGARNQFREGLRDSIAAGVAIGDITRAENKLKELGEDPEATAVQVSALNAFIAAKHKRLSYILPALKAIELTGADGERLNFHISVTPHGEDNGSQS